MLLHKMNPKWSEKKKTLTHTASRCNRYTPLVMEGRLTTCVLYMCRTGPRPPSAPRYPELEPTPVLSDALRRTEWWMTAVLLYNIPGRQKMPQCDSCSTQSSNVAACLLTAGMRRPITHPSLSWQTFSAMVSLLVSDLFPVRTALSCLCVSLDTIGLVIIKPLTSKK